MDQATIGDLKHIARVLNVSLVGKRKKADIIVTLRQAHTEEELNATLHQIREEERLEVEARAREWDEQFARMEEAQLRRDHDFEEIQNRMREARLEREADANKVNEELREVTKHAKETIDKLQNVLAQSNAKLVGKMDPEMQELYTAHMCVLKMYYDIALKSSPVIGNVEFPFKYEMETSEMWKVIKK